MMRPWIIGALLLLTGCAPSRQVERREVRTDTFRAVMAEQLSVCMDDVIILPPDTLRPVVLVKHAELRRRSAAEVVNSATEQSGEDVREEAVTPSPKPPLWLLLLMAVAVGLFIRRK